MLFLQWNTPLKAGKPQVSSGGYGTVGPFLLPHDEPVTLGRTEQCGLRADDSRISRKLAAFTPTPRGWVLENGKRTRALVQSPFVVGVGAWFTRDAQVLLQPADWILTWDLDVLIEATVKYRPIDYGEALPTARDGAAPVAPVADPQQSVGTDLAGDQLNLTDLQRRRLGALFAYLVEDRPKPDQLIQTAAKLSGDSISQITRTCVKVMEHVNKHRDIRIEHIEDLGYHLVKVADVIGPEDVPGEGG